LDAFTRENKCSYENRTRELLELFTLGEGYNEVTVLEAARALTGYDFSYTYKLSFRLHSLKASLINLCDVKHLHRWWQCPKLRGMKSNQQSNG